MLIPFGTLAASGAGPQSDYELISSTVLTGTQANITFDTSTLSSTYRHLQIRGLARTNRNDTGDEIYLRFNNDATALAYSLRVLHGINSSVSTGGAEGQNRMLISYVPSTNTTANVYGAFVTDIINPFSTTRNKSTRTLHGKHDANLPIVGLTSNSWYNTSAVTSIVLYNNASFISGSRFSLYGIKG